MVLRLGFLAGAVSATMASPAFAVEAFVGRWAITPEVCTGKGDTAASAPLVATGTSLSWFAGYCRIGKMYKAGQAVYIQARCQAEGKGDIAVTLDARGDRMRVTWDGAKIEEMRRCK